MDFAQFKEYEKFDVTVRILDLKNAEIMGCIKIADRKIRSNEVESFEMEWGRCWRVSASSNANLSSRKIPGEPHDIGVTFRVFP